MSEVNNNTRINHANNQTGIRVGTTRSQLKTDAQKSIFDKLDSNHDGKIDQKEYNNLATGKVKTKEGKLVDKQFVKIKSLENGRSLVQDANGKQYVMAHNGVILNQAYAQATKNIKVSQDRKNTLDLLTNDGKKAKAEFNKQLADDGWAGDLADGVSALWGSKNRASKVRKDLKTYDNNIAQLRKASEISDEEFSKKFEQIYGVKYNKAAIETYRKNPTDANYKKAFGTKQQNIRTRVADYNQSQQTGAAVVKTTGKIAAGAAVGVATGGAGFVALGAAALGTAAADALIEETDRAHITGAHKDADGKNVKDKGTFRAGTDHAQILKNAAISGASVMAGGAVGQAAKAVAQGSRAIQIGATVTGDVVTGAGAEYLQTGEVTVEGTLMNAGISALGSAVSTGVLKDGINKVKRAFGNSTETIRGKFKSNTPIKPQYAQDGSMIAGGFFGKSNSPSWTERLFGSKVKTMEQHVQDGFNNALVDGKGQKIVSKKVTQAQNGNITAVKELSANTPPSQIARYAREGQVCQIGNKLYVNQGGKALEVKMSRQTFERLFPPEGFARIEQKGLNNCWLVSRLNSMTGSSYGRAQLFSMLEETAQGDIIVHLQGTKPITFKGGKPVKSPKAQLGSGASPGVEMIHQAVLVKVMKGAERGTDNISSLSALRLENEAGTLAHTDPEACRLLLGRETAFDTLSTKEQIQSGLENFNPTRDMATATWGAHARSVVDYNPSTKMVTYHDPYAGGIDITCTLDEFNRSLPHLSIQKAEGAARSPSIPKQEAKPTTVANDTPVRQAPKATQNPAPQQVRQQTAQTADNVSAPVSAAKPKSAFLGSNETTIGQLNGRDVKARITARSSSGIATVEVNGKSYDILPNETLKISDEISIKCNSKGMVTAVNTPKVKTNAPQTTAPKTSPQPTQQQTQPQRADVSNSNLPTGFIDAGTTIRNGQVCRLAKNGNNTMIEIDGRWKLML